MTRQPHPLPDVPPDVGACVNDWRDYLRAERQVSPHTLAAYGRDIGTFLAFMTDHLGGPATLATLGLPRLSRR